MRTLSLCGQQLLAEPMTQPLQAVRIYTEDRPFLGYIREYVDRFLAQRSAEVRPRYLSCLPSRKDWGTVPSNRNSAANGACYTYLRHLSAFPRHRRLTFFGSLALMVVSGGGGSMGTSPPCPSPLRSAPRCLTIGSCSRLGA